MLVSDKTFSVVTACDFHLKKYPVETEELQYGWNPKQTRPLKRRQDIVKTRRLEVLTWDALVVFYSHTGFTWKIMKLLLNLQSAGIKSKTKDSTGYHVRSPIQPQLISLRSTNTRLISIPDYNDTQANL